MLELCVFTFPIRRRKHGEDRGQTGGWWLFLHQRQVWVATDLHADHTLRWWGWNKTVRCVPVLARLLSSVAGERGGDLSQDCAAQSIIISWSHDWSMETNNNVTQLFIGYLSSSWLLWGGVGSEAGTSTVLGPCAMARASRSSSVLNGTCSGFGTSPLDTVENRSTMSIWMYIVCLHVMKKILHIGFL